MFTSTVTGKCATGLLKEYKNGSNFRPFLIDSIARWDTRCISAIKGGADDDVIAPVRVDVGDEERRTETGIELISREFVHDLGRRRGGRGERGKGGDTKDVGGTAPLQSFRGADDEIRGGVFSLEPNDAPSSSAEISIYIFSGPNVPTSSVHLFGRGLLGESDSV